MTEERELIKKLTTTFTKNYVVNMVALGENHQLSVDLLHRLCYDQRRHSVAFRAAWILEYITIHHPLRFTPIFDDFMARLPEQRNFSCQRHFTKILMTITGVRPPLSYADAFRKTDREQMVETVFGWLIDPQTPVAVQANCMDILFNMIPEFDWIASELQSQIDFLLRDGSAALQSRGRKVLGKLKN